MEDKNIIAFIAGILLKVITGEDVNENEIQSLENIVGEMGFYDLDKNEFRY